jgi:hypothetical protein
VRDLAATDQVRQDVGNLNVSEVSDLVQDTPLASPGSADIEQSLAGIGRPPRGYDDDLRPRLASTAERQALGLPRVSVILEFARSAFTANGARALSHHVKPNAFPPARSAASRTRR